MNEKDIWNKLRNKWPILHWIRIENTSASGTPDCNFCYNGHDVWVELKLYRSGYIYLEQFQLQFHLLRNLKGGKSLIFAMDKDRFMVLRLSNPDVLEFAISVGKFKKFNIQYLEKIIEWERPFNWALMFEEFMEKLNDDRLFINVRGRSRKNLS